MLAKRIIPCLDMKDNRVVKGTRFVDLRDVGDPTEMATFYDRQGADELVVLDISASQEKRRTMVETIRNISDVLFIPLTVGGGIDSVSFMAEILSAGADKISLNTAAVNNPQLIKDGAARFGRQCIVVAIDVRRKNRGSDSEPVSWEVYTYGGRTATGRDVIEWARETEQLGAGEILLTSMDADGTLDGYDLDLLRQVTSAVKIPVIASGGAGKLEHLYAALTEGNAHAVLAASILHNSEYAIADIKAFLSSKGLPVRPVDNHN